MLRGVWAMVKIMVNPWVFVPTTKGHGLRMSFLPQKIDSNRLLRIAENSSMSNPPGHLECPEKCNIDADADWMSNAFWICIIIIWSLNFCQIAYNKLITWWHLSRLTDLGPRQYLSPTWCHVTCHGQVKWVKPVKRRTRGHEWESGESQGHQMHWMQWISITRGVATPSTSKHLQNTFKSNITGSTSVICIYLPGYSMPSMPTTAPSKPPTAPIHESLEAGASCFFDISGHIWIKIWAYLSHFGRSCWNERFCHRFVACCIILWPNGLFSERGAPHDDKRGKGWSQNLHNLWGMQAIHTVHGGCMLLETAFNVHPWNICSKYFTPCQRCKTPMVPMVLVMQDTQQASKSQFFWCW